jgi:murein L,D-transpeptidase YafK
MGRKSIVNVIALVFFVFLHSGAAHSSDKAELVVVVKNEGRLYLFRDGESFASFPVVFGSNPKGHKQQQGDGRTPEGEYILDYKNSNSSYYKSLHISYPNARDRENARKRGVNPGGDIVIHGQKNGWGRFSFIAQHFNWTRGCVALSNNDMDAVWEAVDAGTPIEIRP